MRSEGALRDGDTRNGHPAATSLAAHLFGGPEHEWNPRGAMNDASVSEVPDEEATGGVNDDR